MMTFEQYVDLAISALQLAQASPNVSERRAQIRSAEHLLTSARNVLIDDAELDDTAVFSPIGDES